MKNQVAFTVRLNLDNQQDKQAWEHLQGMDRTQYRSYSSLVIKAINSLFESKADVDIVAKLQATIREELSKLQAVSVPIIQEESPPPPLEEDISIALDFADSF